MKRTWEFGAFDTESGAKVVQKFNDKKGSALQVWVQNDKIFFGWSKIKNTSERYYSVLTCFFCIANCFGIGPFSEKFTELFSGFF